MYLCRATSTLTDNYYVDKITYTDLPGQGAERNFAGHLVGNTSHGDAGQGLDGVLAYKIRRFCGQ